MQSNLKEVLSKGAVCLLPSGGLPGLSFISQDSRGKQQLLKIKGREEGKGIVSLVDSLDTALQIWQPLPTKVQQELEVRWPKGLTLVYTAREKNASQSGFLYTGTMQGNEYCIGLRIPDLGPELAWVRELLGQVKVLASSSVNASGEKSIGNWNEALEFARQHGVHIDSRVEKLSQANQSVSSASTVAKILPNGKLSILRQGSVSKELTAFLEKCNGY